MLVGVREVGTALPCSCQPIEGGLQLELDFPYLQEGPRNQEESDCSLVLTLKWPMVSA